MKLAIVGATGRSGQALLERSLAEGHHVVALVRTPEKLKTSHENLTIKKVNIFSKEDLVENLEGCEAVCSCVGNTQWFKPFTPTTFYMDSMTSMVEAMRQVNITKLVCMTAMMITNPDAQNPKWVEYLLKPVLRKTLTDIANMENYLQEKCQDISFTVIKPWYMVVKPFSEKEILLEEGQRLKNGNKTIPYANVAKAMLMCLEEGSPWQNKLVSIGLAK